MIRTALSFAALFAVMVPAQAEPIAVHFAGTVTDILLDDSSGAFGSNFSVGQVVSGSWTFDSNAAIVAKLDNMTAYASSFEVKIGSLAFSGSAEYRIFNDSPAAGDGISVLK